MSSTAANGDVAPALRPEAETVAAAEDMDGTTAIDNSKAATATATATAAATTKEVPPSAVSDRSADNDKTENGEGQKEGKQVSKTTAATANADDQGGEENAEAGAEAEVTYPEPQFGGGDEPWPTQVYMVRVFRPDDDAMRSETKVLEDRISSLRDHIEYLRAGEKLTTATKRNQAIERGKAREKLRTVGAEIKAKVAEKAPLLEQVQQHRAAMDTLRNTARDLPVRNETELDARIAELEDKMMHDTIDLRTEKQYVREIKTLRATREELKNMTEQKGALESSKVHQEELRASLGFLSEELKVLRNEEDMLKKVFEKTREAEQSAEAELKKLYEIRTEKQSQRDALNKELNAIKNKFYNERRAHAKYRAKLSEVGKLIKANRLSDAHGAADAHNTILNDRLNSDAAFRHEHVRLSKKRSLARFVNIMGPWGERQIDEKVMEALAEKKTPAKGKASKGTGDKADDKLKAAPAPAPASASNNSKKSDPGAKAAPVQRKATDANSTHSRTGKKSTTNEKENTRDVLESLPSSSPSEAPSASAAASSAPVPGSQTDKGVSAFLLKSLKGAHDSETMRVIEVETKRAEAEAKEVAEKERMYREKLAQERAAEELRKKQEQEAYAREQQIKKKEAAERAAAKQKEREAREEALKEEKRERRKLRKEKSKTSTEATAEDRADGEERDLHPTSDSPQEVNNVHAQDEVTAETDDLAAEDEDQGNKSSGSRKKHKKKQHKKNASNSGAKRRTIKPPVKRTMATFVSQTWKRQPALIAVVSFSVVFTILVRARPGGDGG